MFSLLTAALVYGAQQAGAWIQSSAGQKTLPTYAPFVLTEIGKKIEEKWNK